MKWCDEKEKKLKKTAGEYLFFTHLSFFHLNFLNISANTKVVRKRGSEK